MAMLFSMLNWIEINEQALIHNLKTFRGLIDQKTLLAHVVKGNAYGHGLIECTKVFAENGADYLCVNALYEAEALKKAGIEIPILILGYVALEDLEKAAELDLELTVYNLETIEKLGELKKPVRVHLKIETGNHRQGILLEEIVEFAEAIKKFSNIKLVGVSTHFANLEDSKNKDYALHQLQQFNEAIRQLEELDLKPLYRHCANTATSFLLPEAHFNFVRIGIGSYGLWPSGKSEAEFELKPALTWKTRVVQIKDVEKNALIGYGCTYKMPRDGKIAVLAVGYYDGFNRLLSNKGQVLIHGKRVPVIGRVAMNMIVVDVTELENLKLEEEAVLIGAQGNEKITTEEMAELTQTINYEVTTRINERIPRVMV